MTVLFTDAFAGGNATPPNANWTNTKNSGLRTLSNQLANGNTDDDNAGRVTAGTFPDDQYAQLTIKTVGASDGGPAVRMDASGNCYFITSFDSTNIYIYELVGGSFNEVNHVTGSYTVNDVIRLDAQGSTVRLIKNGVTILTQTSETSLTTGRPGAFIYDSTMRWDDFVAGDFATGSTVSPSGLASNAVFGTTVVSSTTKTIAPTGLSSNAVFGTTVVTKPIKTISPSGIASAAVFGTTVVSKPVASAGVASAAVYGTAVVTVTVEQISPTGLASAAAYGTATLTVTLEQVSPAGLASAAVFGTAVVNSTTKTVSPSGVASAAVFGTTVVTATTKTLSPSGVASAAAFGTTVVSNVAAKVISPSGIASAAAYGTAVFTNITPSNQSITCTGIASAARYGTATVTVTVETISPTGVASARRVGIAQILGGAVTVPQINLPIRRATTQQTTIKTLSFAVGGKEQPYPVYRGRFSNRRSDRFLEQPGHNPFAGLDEEE